MTALPGAASEDPQTCREQGPQSAQQRGCEGLAQVCAHKKHSPRPGYCWQLLVGILTGGIRYHAHMMPEGRTPSPAPRVGELQRHGRATLSGLEASRESELLLGHALERERAWLFAHADDAVDTDLVARFKALLARRVGGEPVAQILGAWGFWTLVCA